MRKKGLFSLSALICAFTGHVYAISPAQLELERQYYLHHFEASDINEHLPHLRRLAAECSSVVEVGIREVVSTWGILLGLSESSTNLRSYLGIDLNYPPTNKIHLAEMLAGSRGVSFEFWQANELNIEMRPADMIFLDSMHTYCHVTYELEKFSPKIRKYIVMHDTSGTWSTRDADFYYGDFAEYPAHIDRTKRGVWQAVVDFLQDHPEWSLLERHTNNHGLTVLGRTSVHQVAAAAEVMPKEEVALREEVTPALIDYALENKVILCTGPSLHRRQLLKVSTEHDMEYIPFKKIFLTTNDVANLDVAFFGRDPVRQLIPDRGGALDCLNCIITTIKNVAADPECKEDDIIIFKHETVFINDMQLVRQAVKKILEGHDMVVRYFEPGGYFMTDVFYITVGAARKICGDFQELPAFNDQYTICEEFFTKEIVNAASNPYAIDYAHRTRKDTELGFFHIPPRGEENEEGYWDKSNYDTLYK